MKKILSLILISISICQLTYASEVYKVEVKRVDQDLYQIVGKGMYIKTRYCYEYTYGDEAILKIDSSYGFSIGKIIFDNGTSCEVEKLLK